jgi:hypothetical protein
MPSLLHFTAAWAETICGPHRTEIARAAAALGLAVRHVDIDVDPELTTAYGVLNVPAVAIEGRPHTLIVGAHSSDELVERLGPAISADG